MKLGRRKIEAVVPGHELESVDSNKVFAEAARDLGIERRTPKPKAKATPLRKAA